MAYLLTQITLRAVSAEDGREQAQALWEDIVSGKLPLLFDRDGVFRPGISPVTRYSHYTAQGGYDLTILGVTADFFRTLEQETAQGKYKKYEAAGGSLEDCAKKAWAKVRQEESAGLIERINTADYESTVPPEYTRDKQSHCYLYIAVS